MSKSKCESQLEEMTRQRDHWRNRSQEKDREIANLKRQLERAKMWESAFAGGTREKMDEQVNQLQVERDRAVAEADMLYRILEQGYRMTYETLTGVDEWTQEQLQSIYQAHEEHGTPHISAILHDIYSLTESLQIESHQRIRDHMKSQGWDSVNPRHNPQATMLEIMWLQKMIGIRHYAMHLTVFSYGLSGDIRMLADDIIRECQVRGEPDMHHIEQLDLEWIKQHLPDAPTKHSTLFTGLKQYQAFLSCGMDYVAYELKTDEPVPDRTLRKYRGWYEYLREVATFKPEWWDRKQEGDEL